MATPFWQMTGLDIQGEPDDNDRKSLAEVAALEASDRYVTPTQETTERAQLLHEENTAMVSAYRWEMQEELAKEEERRGKILSENEFLTMLGRIVSYKVNDWTARGMRGLSVWNYQQRRYQYVCAIQAGYMPEYSVMHFDAHDLPTNEKYRGWRTVLLRLIMQGFVTEEEAHRIFGPPKLTSVSRRYRKHLYLYRHRKEYRNAR